MAPGGLPLLNKNRIVLTAICLLANFILAGFIVQAGLITEPIAATMGISIVGATKQFTMLYGGYLVGTALVFFGLDYIRINLALILYAIGTLIAAAALYIASDLIILAVLLGILGTLGGASAGIAGTILGRIWQDNHRQTAFLAQDASFNFGGTMYPMATVIILTSGYTWPGVYMFVAAGVVLILALLFAANTEVEGDGEAEISDQTEWNPGIIAAGLALFFTITAKYIIILWLPNYAEAELAATTEESGQIISTIFGMALAGSIIGTLIVTRIKLVYFMLAAVSLGFVSSFQFALSKTVDDLLFLAGTYGVAISVLYNVFTAYGVEFVRSVTHKHVAYILFCGGVAQTIAPHLSSMLVDSSSMGKTLMIGAFFYAAVIALLIATEIWRKRVSG